MFAMIVRGGVIMNHLSFAFQCMARMRTVIFLFIIYVDDLTRKVKHKQANIGGCHISIICTNLFHMLMI